MGIALSPIQSRVIKGIAILMMIFLHLFNHLEDVEQCFNFFYVDGIPLVHWLTRAANPVSFYLFLSGYGLYFSWMTGKTKSPWLRCWQLYRVYWLTLIVMLTIGFFVNPTKYPGSVQSLIENVTGWYTSYNEEAWFLFPYLLLVLTSRWLFFGLERLV